MIDDSDIKKLKEVFGTKEETKEMVKEMLVENNKTIVEDLRKKLVGDLTEVFVTKTDFEGFKDEYRAEFAKVLNPLDKKADVESTEVQENAMLKNKVDRHEKWIKQVAQKVDVRLES